MKYQVELLESNSEIKKQILQAISKQLEQAFIKTKNIIPEKIKILVSQALKNEPEYQSLVGGNLRLEFGISDPSNVDTVIEKLVNTIDVAYTQVKPLTNTLTGSITITMMKSDDLGGVIYDDSAVVKDDKNGYSLPWLEWLLLRGNSVIVKGYSVQFGPNPNSRSGSAVMVSSDQSWRVPPQFVGDAKNNWTTRAIEKIDKEIIDLIKSTVEGSL